MHDLAAEPFVGFRIFRVNMRDNTLMSFTPLGHHSVWLPGQIKESSCSHAPEHGSLPPAFKCTCGIWAVKSRRDLSRAYPGLADRVISDLHAIHHRSKKSKTPQGELSITLADFVKQMQQFTQGLQGLGGSPMQPITFNVPPRKRSSGIVGHRVVKKRNIGGRPIKFLDAPLYLVSARVQMWGIVHEHARGYRAQYAQIMPETLRWWPRQGAWFLPKQLAHIINKYSVTEGGDHDTGYTSEEFDS